MLKTGKTKITTLQKIAEVLNVSTESLLLKAKVFPDSEAKSSETNYKELVINQQKFIEQLGKQIDFLMKENARLNSQISANGLKKWGPSFCENQGKHWAAAQFWQA